MEAHPQGGQIVEHGGGGRGQDTHYAYARSCQQEEDTYVEVQHFQPFTDRQARKGEK